MSSWNVRRRIIATFAAIIAIMLALGVVSYDRLRRIDEAATAIEGDHLPGVVHSGQANALARDLLPAVLTRAGASDPAARQRAAAAVEEGLAKEARVDSSFEHTGLADSERRPFQAMMAARDSFADAYHQAARDGTLTEQEVTTELRPGIERSLAASERLVDLNRREGEAAATSILGSVK